MAAIGASDLLRADSLNWLPALGARDRHGLDFPDCSQRLNIEYSLRTRVNHVFRPRGEGWRVVGPMPVRWPSLPCLMRMCPSDGLITRPGRHGPLHKLFEPTGYGVDPDVVNGRMFRKGEPSSHFPPNDKWKQDSKNQSYPPKYPQPSN